MQGDAGQRDARIGKRKQRQNPVSHPRVQRMLDGHQGRWLRVFGAQRDAERQGDTGQGCVHATFEHTHPQDQTDDHVRRHFYHAHPVHHDQRDEACGCQSQGDTRQFAGVEQCNHDDRTQVVDDCQGHQEQLERHGNTLAQQSQHTQRKGNVGGHRDSPAAECVRVVLVDEPIDQRWHHHAANRRCTGQHDLGRLGQLAFQQLAFDLKADQQEEQGHQAIVDPEQRRFGNLQGTDLHSHGRVQKGHVEVRKR